MDFKKLSRKVLKAGILSKKQKNYMTMDSLKQAKRVIDEAADSLKDKSRVTIPDDVKEIIGATIGAGLGVGAGVVIVGGASAAGTAGAAAMTSGLATAGGIIGGGMMAGIFVVTAPVAVLSIAGYGFVSKLNKNKVTKQKSLLLKEAVCKHNKIIEELADKSNKSKERIDHLTYLNIALRKVIENLKDDLKKAA